MSKHNVVVICNGMVGQVISPSLMIIGSVVSLRWF